MKQTYFLIGLILTMTVSGIAQKQNTQPVGDSSPTKTRSSEANGGSLIQAGTMLDAELQSMVDVRKSKVGDEVILKTKKAIKQNGEVIVPKGSQLIGRVTEIKKKSKNDATSKIGMVFDRIKGKNLDAPINASIVSVLTANASAAAGDTLGADLMGSSSTGGSASARRSGGSGGGSLLGGAGSAVGGLVNSTTSTVGSITNTATSTVGNTVGSTAQNVGRSVNGLQISSSASGSVSSSSTISARNKDVRIEKGATFHMKVDSSVN